jgi:hypothetical protein
MGNFVTAVGRLVAGGFFEPQTKDHKGNPLLPEKYHWFAALAFPKTQADWRMEPAEVFQEIYKAGQEGHATTGDWQKPTFAWKIEDGDADNKNKVGYAGHWIVKFSRSCNIEPVRVVDTAYKPIIDPQVAKKGYYYVISGGAKGNGCDGLQAGVFVNMNMVMLAAAGEEIISGPSAQEVFGGVNLQLPAGAKPLGAAIQQQAAPAAAAIPAPAPAPVAAAPAPAPAPAAVPRLVPVSDLAKANPDASSPYWVNAGWTEELLVANGHFAKTQPAILG